MTILFEDAYNIYQTLNTFAEQKLPIKLSYKIMKIVTSLEGEISFYQKRLQELIDEYALKNEDGGPVITENNEGIQIQPDKIEEFNNEYQELHNMEIDIEDIQFTLDELENLELSPKDLYALQPLIIEN